MRIFNILSKPGKKLVLLIDPEKYSIHALIATLYAAAEAKITLIMVGGSLISDRIDSTLEIIKKHTDIPVVIFPGSLLQLSSKADAVLLLSLISGRNPEYLISNHVIAAPFLKKSGLEVIPTGYILIGEGNSTSVEYISNTKPIPSDKYDLAVATAMAGEFMGNKLIYLESGSGAYAPVHPGLIREVRRNITVPLIVGGGISKPEQVQDISNAGADIIVVGNAIEKNSNVLESMAKAII